MSSSKSSEYADLLQFRRNLPEKIYFLQPNRRDMIAFSDQISTSFQEKVKSIYKMFSCIYKNLTESDFSLVKSCKIKKMTHFTPHYLIWCVWAKYK